MCALILVIFGGSLAVTRSVSGVELTTQESELEDLSSEAVFLTPFIERNELAAGRKAAFVTPLIGNFESYAGFFTVNSTSNSNMFFWFFPAEVDPTTAPVILWLQGGPGQTSLFGLFHENGPFTLLENLTLTERCHRWTRTINVIYIDNPVGTGFSFTDDESAYASDETEVARDLYSALIQFFTIFPSYRTNPFYLAGESYAGKYVPALGYHIHTHNSDSSHAINLQGLAIGNGMMDHRNMANLGEYLYGHGLIVRVALDGFNAMKANVLEEIEEKNWSIATYGLFEIMGLFYRETRNVSIYNYLKDYDDDTVSHMPSSLYMNSVEVKKAIHVGNAHFKLTSNCSKVRYHLFDDFSQSVLPWLEVLINNYRVVLYSGQLDVIIPYPLTLSVVQKMNWNGSAEYKAAKRVQWRVNGKLAGFAKSGGNLTEVLVRNAGHFVPADQPLYAYDLITRVTRGIPFDSTTQIGVPCD